MSWQYGGDGGGGGGGGGAVPPYGFCMFQIHYTLHYIHRPI